MHRLSQLGLALALATVSAASHAVGVTSVATPLSGTAWRIALTLETRGATSSIAGLSIDFDQALFGGLGKPAVPAGWNPQLRQPDTGLAAAGVFDALGAALPAGRTQAGLSVDVTDLGSGTPGPWRDELYAPGSGDNVNVLDGGMTAPVPVPEPSSMWLMALGVAGFAFGAHRIAARKLA